MSGVNEVFGQLMQLQQDVRAGEEGARRRHGEVLTRIDQTMAVALQAVEASGKATTIATNAATTATEAKVIAVNADRRVVAMANSLRRWRWAALPLAVVLLGVGFALGRVTREACPHQPVAELRAP